MSFYLDHQFGELFVETAVETQNIQNLIRNAGVEITGNSPAVVELQFAIVVPAVKVGTSYEPEPTSLPKILQGTICAASNGTRFETTADIDFAERDSDGNFVADIVVDSTNSDGSPANFVMGLTVEAISGFSKTETFVIPNTFVPFRTLTLSSENVTSINSVTDTEGNEYYRVNALSQDTVFKGIPNPKTDSDLVELLLEVLPAPYRYTAETELSTRLTKTYFWWRRGVKSR